MPTRQPTAQRRAYRSPRRAQQAAQTRAAVLAAAAKLFHERGFAATGMRDIAHAAGVAVETVYANFRSKSELLTSAVDAAVVGDAEPVPLADRPVFARLGSGTRSERVAAAAQLLSDIHRRAGGLAFALREAAAADPDLARTLDEAEERRRVSITEGLHLIFGHELPTGVRDGLWAIASTEVYRMLTLRSGWTPQEYQAWMADTIDRLVP